MDGMPVNVTNPVPSQAAQQYVAKTMDALGAQLHSTQWQGWVPGASGCPGGGSLDASVFEVRNLTVFGQVTQGKEPSKC